MKFLDKFARSLIRISMKRLSFSFLTFSLIAVGALCLQTNSAFCIPPGWSLRAQAYPQAFATFMDDNFGRAWMHTVQERVIRRMYTVWCAKNYVKATEKKDR